MAELHGTQYYGCTTEGNIFSQFCPTLTTWQPLGEKNCNAKHPKTFYDHRYNYAV
jgi:hypothetical protein